MIDKDYLAILEDPKARHCITCEHVCRFIYDEPCSTCIHTGNPPGRNRPLWKLKTGLNPKVFGPDALHVENNGQMRLF